MNNGMHTYKKELNITLYFLPLAFALFFYFILKKKQCMIIFHLIQNFFIDSRYRVLATLIRSSRNKTKSTKKKKKKKK